MTSTKLLLQSNPFNSHRNDPSDDLEYDPDEKDPTDDQEQDDPLPYSVFNPPSILLDLRELQKL